MKDKKTLAIKKQRIRFALLSKNKTIADNQLASKDGWNVLNQITGFVEGLELPGLDAESGNLYSIITSVPSPWARAYMMNNALRCPYVQLHQKDNQQGMNTLYSSLQDEYKGLITTLALYNSNIKVKKIDLKYLL